MKEPGYNHLVMEIEFDRYLLKKAGKNPLLYPAWKYIRWDKQTLDVLPPFLREKEKTVPADVKNLFILF